MRQLSRLAGIFVFLLSQFSASAAAVAPALPPPAKTFFEQRCIECHDSDTRKGDLDLTALSSDLSDAATFARWVKIHDRIESGEMPPKKKPRPPVNEVAPVLQWMSGQLVEAEKAQRPTGRATFRRLTRVEYEHTIQDLLGLRGMPIREDLPPDGSVAGFNKLSDALDISHVQMAKYMEVAKQAIELSTATYPNPHAPELHRYYPALESGFPLGLLSGHCVLLKDKKPDPALPVFAEKPPKDQTKHWHEDVMGPSHSAVGTFRPSEAGANLGFKKFKPPVAGRYKVRISVWSFYWDKGNVLPSRRTQTVGISNTLGLIGYFDAPSLESKQYEREVWLDQGDELMFNAASLEHTDVPKNGQATAYEGPGIAIDWLEVEGPVYESWPQPGHMRLFGSLPIVKFVESTNGPNPPDRGDARPGHSKKPKANQPKKKPASGEEIWTVASKDPAGDARRLLKDFLPRAFRRPVPDEQVERYAGIVQARMSAGDCFEDAMKMAYQAALCSPEFLFRIESPGRLDDYAIANRLSYFLWNTMPDDDLLALAARGALSKGGDIVRQQARRMLDDPRSNQFISDFLDQWLAMNEIADNTPDKMLYPEFKPYMQDCMVAETRGFFRELIHSNLGIANLVDSDFAMLNTELGNLYGVPNPFAGDVCSRVQLPLGSHRGGLLTQASVLKVTANGTVTSPVKRGAWIMDRLLGKRPDPPPPSVVAIDPDLRGTTTIREQLDKHRSDASCAVCHSKMDPPGFALESYDVIGRWRDRYRSKELGDDSDARVGENHFRVKYKLGPKVDCTGQTVDGVPFTDIEQFKPILMKDKRQIAQNLLRRLSVYATGAETDFADRAEIERILDACVASNSTEPARAGAYRVRDLIEFLVTSELFLLK